MVDSMDVPSPIFETLWKYQLNQQGLHQQLPASSFNLSNSSGDSVDDSTSKKSQEDQQEKTCPYAEL